MKRVLISGGGTGGHIFPALAIADAIKKIDPLCEILFVGAEGKMEMEKVPSAGYKILGLPVRGFQRKLTLQNVSVLFNLVRSLFTSWKIISEFRPDAILGVGGYASGPIMRVGAWRKIPVFIQEQNSYPGITNKLMASNAKRIFVAYEGMSKFFDPEKISNLGNPVRKDLSAKVSRNDASAHFQLDPNKKTIGVFGGSLGARALNELVTMIQDQILKDDSVQVIWQIGKIYESQYTNHKLQTCNRVKINSFITRMDLAYAACDLIVCRAGALTLSELAVTEVPAILIPSPNVAEDHQRKNAEALVKEGAAKMILEKELTANVWNIISDLLSNQAEVEKMKSNLRRISKPNAAEEIAFFLVNS